MLYEDKLFSVIYLNNIYIFFWQYFIKYVNNNFTNIFNIKYIWYTLLQLDYIMGIKPVWTA